MMLVRQLMAVTDGFVTLITEAGLEVLASGDFELTPELAFMEVVSVSASGDELIVEVR